MIFTAPVSSFPTVHTILNTGIALVAVGLSLLFWDLGSRTGDTSVRLTGIVFAGVGLLEIAPLLAPLDPSSRSEPLNELLREYRVSTWAPPSYLLPLGLAATSWAARRGRHGELVFALLLMAAATLLFGLFQGLPRYSTPGWLGIS